MAENERYFAAANSGDGFFSLFSEVFDRKKLDKIYILRGGPGTGKSTLMKKIGRRGEDEGFTVHYIPCSSDVSSLDGVIIPEKAVAVFDGTAPHSAEPKYPYAAEVTAELYGGLGEGVLRGKRAEIIALTDHAALESAAAYEYLFAAAKMKREALYCVRGCFDGTKAARAAKREVSALSAGGEEKRRFISSVDCDGMKTLDTYKKLAKTKTAVTDKFGLGYEFMRLLLASAREKGALCTRFSDPIAPELTEALWFENDKVYFFIDRTEDEECDKKLNIMRFVSREKLRESRQKLRFAARCEEALTCGAVKCFGVARKDHDALESIYSDAMDFRFADITAERIIAEIFD